MQTRATYLLSHASLGDLITVLIEEGCTVVGPRLRDGALAYDVIHRAADLAEGWSDEQRAGSYRLRRRVDATLFQNGAASNTWKRFLFPPQQKLWCASRRETGFGFEAQDPSAGTAEPLPPLAFIGVRPCDLAAIAIQDRVFLGGSHADPHYRRRREALFLVVVQCSHSAATCFCASLGTGPGVEAGFDVALTELVEAEAPSMVAQTGSERGRALLERIRAVPASAEEIEAARAATQRAASQQTRSLHTQGIRERMESCAEDPGWDDVAARCLACGNCTLVCPTCFCSSVEDRVSLDGQRAERWRRWDSCFGIEHSYLHGGSVRVSTRARYRQWLTHKLGTWIDQFGTPGCVGCGRCITWCPAGIDLTVEARAIGESEHGKEHSRPSR